MSKKKVVNYQKRLLENMNMNKNFFHIHGRKYGKKVVQEAYNKYIPNTVSLHAKICDPLIGKYFSIKQNSILVDYINKHSTYHKGKVVIFRKRLRDLETKLSACLLFQCFDEDLLSDMDREDSYFKRAFYMYIEECSSILKTLVPFLISSKSIRFTVT